MEGHLKISAYYITYLKKIIFVYMYFQLEHFIPIDMSMKGVVQLV